MYRKIWSYNVKNPKYEFMVAVSFVKFEVTLSIGRQLPPIGMFGKLKNEMVINIYIPRRKSGGYTGISHVVPLP